MISITCSSVEVEQVPGKYRDRKSSGNGENLFFSPPKKCHPLQQVEATSGSLGDIPERDSRRSANVSSHRIPFDDLQSSPVYLTFFLQSITISCRSAKLTPPRLLQRSLSISLSLCFLVLSGDSLTILCSRSNPDLQGSLPGAPFNCLVQPAASRRWNDSARIWSHYVSPCYFLLGCPFPLNACSYHIHYSQTGYYSVTYSFPSVNPHCFQKNKNKILDFQGSFHHSDESIYLPLPTLAALSRKMFHRSGREAGVASIPRASRPGRFLIRFHTLLVNT